MSEQESKKKNRMSSEQTEILIRYMEKNRDFARGEVEEILSQVLWKKRTQNLNAAEGPVRELKSWQKCWTDLSRSLDRRVEEVRSGKRMKLCETDVRLYTLRKKEDQTSQDKRHAHDRSRSPRPLSRRSPPITPRQRSPSITPRRRSPSVTPGRRSPSVPPRRRSPSITPRRRSISPPSRRRTPSPAVRQRSPSPPPRKRSPSYGRRFEGPSSNQKANITSAPTIDLTIEANKHRAAPNSRRLRPASRTPTGSNTSAVIQAMQMQTRVVKELIEKVVAASEAQNQTMRDGFELVAGKMASVVRKAVDHRTLEDLNLQAIKPDPKLDHRTPEDFDLQAMKPDPKLETCYKSDCYFEEDSDEELFFGDIEAFEEHVENDQGSENGRNK